MCCCTSFTNTGKKDTTDKWDCQKDENTMPGLVPHVCNPSMWEAEAGELPWVQGQLELHHKILFSKNQTLINKISLKRRKRVRDIAPWHSTCLSSRTSWVQFIVPKEKKKEKKMVWWVVWCLPSMWETLGSNPICPKKKQEKKRKILLS